MTFMESDTIVDLSSIVMVHRRIWSNEKCDILFCSMTITIVSYPCNHMGVGLGMRENVSQSMRLHFNGATIIAIAIYCKNPSKGKRDTAPPNKDRCCWNGQLPRAWRWMFRNFVPH